MYYNDSHDTAISIHAPRAGGDPKAGSSKWSEYTISIHAPRAGGDKSVLLRGAPGYISIHAPRAGGDPVEGWEATETTLFQSTPPVRGATA